MLHRTHHGRAFRLLTIMDEFSRECLAIDVARQLKADNVLDRLTWLFAQRGAPRYIRSDNGPEFTASKVRQYLSALSVNTRGVALRKRSFLRNSQATAPAVAVHRARQSCGSPIRLENGYLESFNGKLRDELLNVESFDTLLEAQVLVERWRNHYNTERTKFSLCDCKQSPRNLRFLR